MWFCLASILVIMCCFPCSFQIKRSAVKNPEEEWKRMATSKGSSGAMPKVFRNAPSHSNFLWLPDFVRASSAMAQKALFSPAVGAHPLPNSVQPLLFPTTTVATPAPSQPPIVEMLCHLDRIYVRIRRDIFKTLKPWRFLKLGTCVVNQGTADHYYFLYLLTTDCNYTFEHSVDSLTAKNVLHYLPTTAVLRDMPFSIAVQCTYHRYIHSYKVGIWPKIEGGTLYKSLRRATPILIVPQDESGNERTTPYTMGDTMFFEVKPPNGTESSPNARLYINKCFITTSLIPTSVQNVIIDNYGCMVDGQESENSKFLSGPSMMIQRFSVNAGVVLGIASMASSTQQLYMHCEVFVGIQPPSGGSKACNYNLATGMWTELYGYNSVCSCCTATCLPSMFRAFRRKVTSQPWTVNLNSEEDDFKKN